MADILIADDSKFMRNVLKDILVRSGNNIVWEAPNGASTIEGYFKMKPDLTFLDVTMDTVNGLDALKEIIRMDLDAKIIMCSSMGQKCMILEAIQMGAKDFIIKPFTEERVINCVRRYTK